MPGEGIISNTLLETELYFECIWYEQAWNELEEWSKSAIPMVRADSIGHNISSWEFVNRLLVHAARIRRLVNPTSKGDNESPEAYAERKKFAAELSKRFNPELLNSKHLGRARNIVEHANEYLVDYLMKHDEKAINMFRITWGSVSAPDAPRYPSFRAYDHDSGECSVNGFPVNLRSTLGIVQELRSRTHAHVEGEPYESGR